MKFVGDVNGSGATEVEAVDADDAAEKLAEREFSQSGGETPSDNQYLVCLLSIPDYEFFVRCVTIEFAPRFSTSTTDQEPEDDVFDNLICEARRAEKALGVVAGAT